MLRGAEYPAGRIAVSEPRVDERTDFFVTPPVVLGEPIVVTVIVPTFAAAGTLERALSSALGQSLRPIEVIVVDDASTDGSWDLITARMAADARLRAIRHLRNRGKPVGMNRAIDIARGRWIAVLDADDWYHPDRLLALVTMGEARGADMVADNQFFYDAMADRLVGTAWKPAKTDWPLSFDGFLEGANAYATFNLGMLKPVIRTDFIRRTALNYDEEARHGQDFFHLLQFYLAGGKGAVSDTPFYYYTQPFGAVSRCWSHATRKRYDFQTAYLINRRHTNGARAVLTRGQMGRLVRRNNQLRALELYYQAKQCAAERDYWGTAMRLLQQPEMMGYAAWRLRRRLLNYPDSRPIERVAARSRAVKDTETKERS
jgi:succinoglycan biosynthesis protein ExoO